MNGFKIKHGNKCISAGNESEGLTYVFISCMDGRCDMTVSGSYPGIGKRYTWVDEEIRFGEKIEIEFSEIGKTSAPVSEKDTPVMNELDIKLKSYLKHKEFLKEKGVI